MEVGRHGGVYYPSGTSWHMHLHVTKLYCINNLACWRLYSVQTCKGFITFRSRCVGSRRTLTVIGCHTHRHLCPHYRLGAPYPSMNDRPIVVHRSERWADMTMGVLDLYMMGMNDVCYEMPPWESVLSSIDDGAPSIVPPAPCGLVIRAWWILYLVKLTPLSGFEILRNRRILWYAVVSVWW